LTNSSERGLPFCRGLRVITIHLCTCTDTDTQGIVSIINITAVGRISDAPVITK